MSNDTNWIDDACRRAMRRVDLILFGRCKNYEAPLRQPYAIDWTRPIIVVSNEPGKFAEKGIYYHGRMLDPNAAEALYPNLVGHPLADRLALVNDAGDVLPQPPAYGLYGIAPGWHVENL